MSILPKSASNKKLLLATVLLLLVVIGVVGAVFIMQRRDLDKDESIQAAREPFSFAAVGDFGAGDDFKSTLRTIKSSGANFTLALGDFSYGKIKPESAWCDIVTNELGQSYPFELVVGNHDEGSKPGQGHISQYASCLPDKLGTIQGQYAVQYYFDYNNLARFIIVSPDIQIDGKQYSYEKGSTNYQWLEQAIDDSRGTGIPWTIVAMHETCISIGEKDCEIGEDIMNLLIEKKVDLILQGHEHGYMRSKQLHLNDTCTQIHNRSPEPSCMSGSTNNGVFKRGEGPVLVINGTGGIELRDIDVKNKDYDFFESWSGKNINPSHGPNIIDVTKDALLVRYQTNTGNVADNFQVK